MAVMGHELVCIIYAAGPTQPVGVGLVSEWYAGDRGMVVLLVRRRRPVGLYLHSERREGDAVSPWSAGSGGVSRWLMEHSRRSGGARTFAKKSQIWLDISQISSTSEQLQLARAAAAAQCALSKRQIWLYMALLST